MAAACDSVVATTLDAPELHANEQGWYSHSVLVAALEMLVPPRCRMLCSPLVATIYEEMMTDGEVYGAVINHDNIHWTCIVYHNNSLWHLDSCSKPRVVDQAAYAALLHRHPMTFAIVACDSNL